ncbi:hypothetical protein ACVW0P_003502, partial [Mucilaginibacter sp. UYNi724]
GSVCPEIPWSVCPETVGQLAPKWCGLIHHNLQIVLNAAANLPEAHQKVRQEATIIITIVPLFVKSGLRPKR